MIFSIFNPKLWVYFFYYINGLNNMTEHKYKKAIKLFTKSLFFCPKNNIKLLGLAYGELGICYTDIDDIDRGEFYLLKSLEINPVLRKNDNLFPEIFSRLGFIYKERGQYNRAKEYLNKAIVYKNKKRKSFTNWDLVERYHKELSNI